MLVFLQVLARVFPLMGFRADSIQVDLGTYTLAGHQDTLGTLDPGDPVDFDYYVCGGDKLQQVVKQYAGKQAIPDNQFLFEAI